MVRVPSLIALLFSSTVLLAQGSLPWGPALSAPLESTTAGPAGGVFRVADFSATGAHTDYDIARQAADAYAAANPASGSVLILKTGVNETCDAVPLPSLGTSGGKWSTTTIFGFGSGVSRIVKKNGCPASAATLSHLDSPTGQLSRGWYQGFTVDANHIDAAACNLYGMSLTTFLDVACGNAAIGADHEAEFGNRDANSVGWMDNIYIYNLKTFDTIGGGKGAVLTPKWAGGSLAAVVLTNAGTKRYTQQLTHAQLIGPDVATCSSLPALTPTVSNLAPVRYQNVGTVNYGFVTGARVTAAGKCGSTARIYILVQDGAPVTYGMKFSNMADSHVWNLEPTGSSTYGEAWLFGTNNNLIYGEHPYTNQTIQIAEYGNGNRHIGAFFDSPGQYGAAIYGQNGTFQHSIFSWDGTSYLGSSGYFFNNDPRVYHDWTVENSQCTNSTSGFLSIMTLQGSVPGTAVLPAAIKLRDIERCDGTNVLDWPATAY